MEYNFYQTNNKMLVLDPCKEKDIDYIRFNHYISRKENLQRTKEELDRGLFKFSYISAINDLKISRRKLQRIVKWFEDSGIIECIEKSNTKNKASVYAYTSVYYDSKSDINRDINSDTNSDINKPSNFNGFNSMSDINSDTNCDINSDTSKKEKEKENIKKSSTSLASASSSLAYTEKVFKGKTKVKCRYDGATVNATRFDELSHHYRNIKENEYKESDGFIYEISRREIERANRNNNQNIRMHDDFSTKKEPEFEEITDSVIYLKVHNDF